MTAGIIALIYFALGTLLFIKKIRLYTITSSFLLFVALHIVAPSQLLTAIWIAVLLLTFAGLLIIKSSRDKRGVFYFSLPCWLLIASVIIDLFWGV
ncbi:hypothetical protein GA0061071_107143 [Kosakonia oryzendophytica]|uniref:Inner membrane protein n=1 Tax=Kosakonia oryzendophytica TaxID=1005665 RepID=A0A1C4CDP8_9ENTR|nr:hypothetical protein [Kosakonia oryzendophytica]AMO49891.1 putative inner membrane protein [Enterobacter sp. FY-07]TDT59236.1 hypothetical protein DFO53_0807 [Enterobacter sp. AG5470]WBT60184.1 hypothetical protein O9K67_10655 [Kosakonia oryzendophytica]SCC17225.1 hypothetical protein GA0061071_107143 [Kosakonia oryzendophytica]